MGKTAGLLIVMLMINLIGYIALTDYVDAYPADKVENKMNSLMNNNPLMRLYGSSTLPDGNVTYDLTSNSTLYAGIPTGPPEGYLSGAFTFIDRIFILFDWVRAIVAIGLFPVTLLSLIGLPWQLAMLLGIPLATLYVLGIIDIFSGGGT